MNRSLYLAILLGGCLLATTTWLQGHPPGPGSAATHAFVPSQHPIFAHFSLAQALETRQISWKLSSPQAASLIYIERSTDGVGFEMVGGVRVTGAQQQFEDVLPFADGDLFYRLKAVMADGKIAYSAIQKLRYTHTPELIAFPNPVQSLVSLRMPLGLNNAEIQVFDGAGVVIQTVNWQRVVKGGISDMTLNLSRLDRGFYLIKATQGSRSWHTKVFKR